MIGSTRLARRAGSHTARNATTVNTTGTPVKTTGSQAPTPNSKVAINRVRPKAAAQSDNHPDQRQAHPLHDNHILDVRGTRAEGQPNADLLSALVNRIRHQAVDADRGEK